MSLRHVYKWIKHFNAGWSDMHDKKQTDHLQDPINDETIASVHTLLAEDR